MTERQDEAHADVSLQAQLHDALEDLDLALESSNKKRIENAKADIEWIKKEMARKVSAGGNPRKDAAGPSWSITSKRSGRGSGPIEYAVERGGRVLKTFDTKSGAEEWMEKERRSDAGATVAELSVPYQEGYDNGRRNGNPSEGSRLYAGGDERDAWKRGRRVGVQEWLAAKGGARLDDCLGVADRLHAMADAITLSNEDLAKAYKNAPEARKGSLMIEMVERAHQQGLSVARFPEPLFKKKGAR